MEIGRRELIKTLVASACLAPLGVTAFGATATPVDTYVQRMDRLMARHRSGVSRLRAPAEMTADALIAGGSLSLGGAERGWDQRRLRPVRRHHASRAGFASEGR